MIIPWLYKAYIRHQGEEYDRQRGYMAMLYWNLIVSSDPRASKTPKGRVSGLLNEWYKFQELLIKWNIMAKCGILKNVKTWGGMKGRAFVMHTLPEKMEFIALWRKHFATFFSLAVLTLNSDSNPRMVRESLSGSFAKIFLRKYGYKSAA